MITVILNGYKRAENLNEQLEALKNQTLPPDEILFWYNNPGDNDLINYDIGTEIAGAYCNYNFGVWARFAFAFMAIQFHCHHSIHLTMNTIFVLDGLNWVTTIRPFRLI